MAKFYYNGVLLPEMPSNAIAGGYQCQFIRKNTESGYYDLLMSPQKWYYSDGTIKPVYTNKNWWYRIEIATADEATEWTFKESTTSNFGVSSTRPILWSSHSIPNGSISATEMYIEGTEPIPEDEGEEKNYFYLIKTETLESFADEARRINGSTDLLTTEQMIEIFGEAKIPKLQDKTITENGTYQADSGYDGLGSVTVEVASSLEGLENGYDVMFYDENNDGLAFYSIKQGHSINPPVYNCKTWQTEDGQSQEFPFTPTEDIILYANNDTYASQLYEYYGVDSVIYPYLFINFRANNYSPMQCTFKVTFGKSMPDSYYLNDVLTASYSYNYGNISDVPDLNTFVQKVMGFIQPSALVTADTERTETNKQNIYATNYDVKESYISQFYAHYRLDE